VIYDNDAEKAWQTVCIIPAIVAFRMGIIMYLFSEDSSKGNYGHEEGWIDGRSFCCWIFLIWSSQRQYLALVIQYATCFGVELTMNNAAAIYFKEEFDQTTESAAAIASLFGWMNLFARGLGGYCSDKLIARMGMRGRLAVHTFALLAEGAMVLVFANSTSLAGSIVILVVFSTFVQMAEGTSYGIVPYVDPPNTGTISGIIGAGGNTGAVLFGLCFRRLSCMDAFYISWEAALWHLPSAVLSSSFLDTVVS
jgi:MFS transporter, NNP family, nitrate/nitrite transporter